MTKAKLFIGVKEPRKLRKNLLESAKMSVGLLKSQYQLSEMREERKQVLDELASSIGRVSDLVVELRETLPAFSEDDLPADVKKGIEEARETAKELLVKKTKKKESVSTPVSAPKTPAPKVVANADDSLADLERKLASIQEKLNKL